MSSDIKISKDQLLHIAKLSRLEVKPEEENYLASQLSETASYIDVLTELNTDNVFPTPQVTNLKNVMRQDNIEPSLSQEDALSQAPDVCDGYFKTQATIKK